MKDRGFAIEKIRNFTTISNTDMMQYQYLKIYISEAGILIKNVAISAEENRYFDVSVYRHLDAFGEMLLALFVSVYLCFTNK